MDMEPMETTADFDDDNSQGSSDVEAEAETEVREASPESKIEAMEAMETVEDIDDDSQESVAAEPEANEDADKEEITTVEVIEEAKTPEVETVEAEVIEDDDNTVQEVPQATVDEEDEENGNQTYDPDTDSSPEKKEEGKTGGETAVQPAVELVEDDTEMVSEDELEVDANAGQPTKETLDTEEVSDEELPTSITEGLQTEAVSDEELPPLGKRRKKEASESGHSHKDVPAKKGKLDKDGSPPPEDREDVEKQASNKPVHPAVKSKVLPELEKYWKAVNDDPTDFTGWTYLLQYVDQESDVEAAREAYDSFLALYPYCYGYWRKYADYEKRKGDKEKCEEVFLRGLKSIPLSVDLWLHYLNFCKVHYKENESRVRAEFSKALDICGLEFRSDRLWDSFIKWETEGKHYNNSFKLYERLLMTPTQGYKTHFEDFEDFVRCQQPNKILGTDEFLSLRSEVLQKLKSKPLGKEGGGPPSAAPPGDEEGEIDQPSPAHADEETTLIRERIISSRKKLYKDTVTAVLARWNFEEGIKRPYFHVKPLERSQLNTWREYLDFEMTQADEERTVILFERCLIACALYQEFWLKFIKYLEDLPKDTASKVRDVYERACLIHHPKKPFLSLSWATFEESLGNIEEARKILTKLEENVPNILHVSVRRINLERRAGNLDTAAELYEKYISQAKSKANFIALSIKYARFAWKILNDVKRGIQVLRKALEKDSDNPRLYSQLLELTLMTVPFSEEDCLKIFNEAIENDKMDVEFRRIFAQRKVEFLEDFGTSIKSLRDANVEYSTIMKELREKIKSSVIKHDVDKAKQEELLKNSSSKTKPGENASNANYNASYAGSNAAVGSNSYSSINYDTTSSGGNYTSQGYQSQPPFYSGGSQPGSNEQPYQPSPYQNWGGYSQTAGYSNYNQNWTGYNYYS